MVATATGTYTLTGHAAGHRDTHGTAQVTYRWAGVATGHSAKTGAGQGRSSWAATAVIGDNGEHVAHDPRFRVIVQETRTHQILSRDLTVSNLRVQRALSGPCQIGFDVSPHEPSAAGIYFKPWAQYIHLERVIGGKRRIWATGIVQPSEMDKNSGILHLKATGFAGYPKDLPWLENIQWIQNDAFDPVTQIWAHLQSYPGGDLGVTVSPKKSGAEMLPGYSYDGDIMNSNFYATFVRATDKLDCGDYIDALAKDTPFDYREQSAWNTDRTDITKTIELGYPRLGMIQPNLAFVVNENVTDATPHIETQIDWVSDIGVQGWFPGKEYSYTLANADPTRLRRYLKEDDAGLDSNERTAAWAHRKLARRQTPAYWEKINVDTEHPNAPFGTFDVGDTITVTGYMPWVGEVVRAHKILAIEFDEAKNTCQLTLYAEGAFNYDPIFFPDGDVNIITNPGFDHDLDGWTATGPGWTWDATQGAAAIGSATIAADGTDHDLYTQPYGVTDFQIVPLAVWVRAVGAVATDTTAISLVAQFYDQALAPTQAFQIAAATNVKGLVPWQQLSGQVITPAGSSHVALRVHVDATMTAGRAWFDDAELDL